MIKLFLEDYEQVEVFENEDRRVFILRRKDGLHCWAVMRFWHPAEDDEGVETGWQGEYLSGIYESAQQAGRAARQAVSWLRN